MTPTGARPIESIREGDSVWAYDFESESWVSARVRQTLCREYDGPIVTIFVGDETISATGDHPFWIEDGISLAERPLPRHVDPFEELGNKPHLSGRWVDARHLRPGDRVRLFSGTSAVVRDVLTMTKRVPVFNLEIESAKTFAVGNAGLLVHNRSMPFKPLHGATSMRQSTLEYWRKKTTQEIIDSLKPGSKEALRIKPDGTIMNGNHRIQVLQERGVDVSTLPYETYTGP